MLCDVVCGMLCRWTKVPLMLHCHTRLMLTLETLYSMMYCCSEHVCFEPTTNWYYTYHLDIISDSAWGVVLVT